MKLPLLMLLTPFGTIILYNYLEKYLQERTESLHDRLQWVAKNADKLDGVNIGNNKIHVDKLEKDTPEDAISLRERLYKLLPRVKLPNLLIEFANWTDFDRNFVHASTGNIAKSVEKAVIMAALMTMGTNMGLVKMADSITYRQMANTTMENV